MTAAAHPSLTAPLNEEQLRLMSTVQRIVYRSIRMTLGDAGEKCPDKFPAIVDLIRVWCGNFAAQGEIRNSEVVFDETIWPPSQPERHGAVVRVFLAPTPRHDIYILEIDLTKGYHDCASLVSDRFGSTPIDPFNVVFQLD